MSKHFVPNNARFTARTMSAADAALVADYLARKPATRSIARKPASLSAAATPSPKPQLYGFTVYALPFRVHFAADGIKVIGVERVTARGDWRALSLADETVTYSRAVLAACRVRRATMGS